MTIKAVFLLMMTIVLIPSAFADPSEFDSKSYLECQAYIRSDEVPPPEAVATCLPSAEYGIPSAQYALAFVLLRHKKGDEGLPWLEKAAKSGSPLAQYMLANVLLQASSAAQQDEAKEYFRQAACSGLPFAQPDYMKRMGSEPQCSDTAPRSFDGTWEGELSWKKQTTIDWGPDEPIKLRVVIAGDKTTVYVMSDSEWNEVKPGKFLVQQLDETMIVSALDSGWDKDGKWIESWNIQLLRVAPDKALMTFLRTVNNMHVPESTGIKYFTKLAEGNAKRS